jgi:2-oxoglutarate ferredoxin oxidoreductase subunit gamma
MVLGRALVLHEGMEAVLTQSYGPEARGGASSANLVVSDEPIDYPFVQGPDVLIAMSQEAYITFRPTARPDAIVLIDDDLVQADDDDHPRSIPATRLAEGLGHRVVANIVMLGFLVGTTGLTRRESVEEAIRASVRPKTLDLNLRAFAAGLEHATTTVSGESRL